MTKWLTLPKVPPIISAHFPLARTYSRLGERLRNEVFWTANYKSKKKMDEIEEVAQRICHKNREGAP